MAGPRRRSEAMRDAAFVFKGTVQKVPGATMASVPVDDTTAIVRVDQILRAPEALAGLTGDVITVKLTERARPKRGEQAIFHTTGWLVGDGIAVRSLGHTDVDSAAASRAAHPRDPVAAKAARDLERHRDDADLVVTGRVTAVRMPAEPPRRAATVKARAPISEHAPAWREAIIDVHDVHKGAGSPKRLVVRFPSSTDVRWAAVPKFHPGQRGVFLLHAVAGRGVGKTRYEALHRDDFRPLDPLAQATKASRAEKQAR